MIISPHISWWSFSLGIFSSPHTMSILKLSSSVLSFFEKFLFMNIITQVSHFLWFHLTHFFSDIHHMIISFSTSSSHMQLISIYSISQTFISMNLFSKNLILESSSPTNASCNFILEVVRMPIIKVWWFPPFSPKLERLSSRKVYRFLYFPLCDQNDFISPCIRRIFSLKFFKFFSDFYQIFGQIPV